MTPGEIIEQLAERAYENGVDPVHFATAVLEVVTEEIFDLPCHDPRTRMLSRRIVACLLEAGWTSPVVRRTG
jgi:hypothetical protein